MIGTCSAVGRSTPLNPIFDRIWQRSSNESFEFAPHTEAITLCRIGLRLGAGAACAPTACSGRATAASGAAAMPAMNSLLCIAAIYFASAGFVRNSTRWRYEESFSHRIDPGGRVLHL